MKFCDRSDLPDEYTCQDCGATKPVADMVVVELRRDGLFDLRPQCKECQGKSRRAIEADKIDYNTADWLEWGDLSSVYLQQKLCRANRETVEYALMYLKGQVLFQNRDGHPRFQMLESRLREFGQVEESV